MNVKRLFALLLCIVMALSLTACGGGTEDAGTQEAGGGQQDNAGTDGGAAAQNTGSRPVIGITLPTQELARCLKDQEYLTEYLGALGYDVDVQFARGDAATQANQIENMITNGVVGVIISPWDGSALTNAVQACADANIPVIAYDALVMNSAHIEYYAADDLEGIGALQAQFIVDSLGLESNDESFTIELFGGDYADANAPLFYSGAMAVLDPYIASGRLRVLSGQTDFNTCATPEWDGTKAQARMDTLLSSFYLDEDVAAVLCQNDDVAAGVISACKSAGYGTADRPLPITTGQDCALSALKSILAGEQTMTVYKDIRELAENGAYMIDCLVRGVAVELDEMVVYNNGAVDVIATQIEPIALTIDNLEELIIGNDYYTAEELGL